MGLTAELEEQYWRDGYALVPGLFGADALERYESRFLELETGRQIHFLSLWPLHPDELACSLAQGSTALLDRLHRHIGRGAGDMRQGRDGLGQHPAVIGH